HERAVRRDEPEGARTPVPCADGRLDADRAAAGEQHRPRRDPGVLGDLRRNAVAAHERVRRGARTADRGFGEGRAPHAADHRLRRRRTRHGRPARRLLLHQGPDRRARVAGLGADRAGRRLRRRGRGDRARLRAGRDRAVGLRLAAAGRARRARDRRRQPLRGGRDRARRAPADRSCGRAASARAHGASAYGTECARRVGSDGGAAGGGARRVESVAADARGAPGAVHDRRDLRDAARRVGDVRRGSSSPVVRILIVSQMYPGPDAPDLGTFVAQVEHALVERGHHHVDRAVLDTRSGGKLRYLELAKRTRGATTPDVVYAHFLVPSGLIAALGPRAPLVVTAHGRDVRNVGWLPGIGAATALVVRRATTVICVSEYLRRELETKVPSAIGKTEVVSSGVDLERFAVEPVPNGASRFLCIGALEERKNVVRLADAFARLGEGTLTFAGDGSLRDALEQRPGVTLLGRVPHDEIPGLVAASHVVC